MVVLPQFGFPASAILIAIFSSLSFLVVVMLCGSIILPLRTEHRLF